MVQCVTGLDILTARDMFVMRWIPDLSVARTLTVRILALMTTALMLTAPQASTVSILTLAHDSLEKVAIFAGDFNLIVQPEN